jgi:lipopolysaccharide biosynthesis glycosyltransferase
MHALMPGADDRSSADGSNGTAPLAICCSIDAGFAMQLAVCLRSLFHHHDVASLEVHVLTAGVDDRSWRSILHGLPPGARVRRHPVDPARVGAVQTPPRLPRAAFVRLLMGSVLPPALGRVLYLDADVMCRTPLHALWATDLGGHAIGAVADARTPWLGSPYGDFVEPRWRQLGLAPDNPYFNSGVMLIDLNAWRAGGFEQTALRLCQRHLFANGDQEGVLGACGGRWQRLHPRWNMLPAHFNNGRNYGWVFEGEARMREALAAPGIVHFTRGLRPWVFSFKSRHPHGDEWLALLEGTSWRGWRPRPRPMRGLLRALDRAVRGTS